MALDILGAEITAGDFIIWQQTNVLIPMAVTAPNRFEMISPGGTEVRVHIPRARAKYIKITVNQMRELLQRRPLPRNLFVRTSRWTDFSHTAGLSLVRTSKAEAFYNQFISAIRSVTGPGQIGYTVPFTRQVLEDVRQQIENHSLIPTQPISRPLLALPAGTPVELDRSRDRSHLRLPQPTVINFTNIDGQPETLTISNPCNEITGPSEPGTHSATTSRQSSALDLDFDD